MSSNRRKFARLFLLFLAVVNSIALTIVVEQKMPSHKPFQDLPDRLVDLRLYRMGWQRILSLTLYYLEVIADSETLYKIGVTTRSLEERIPEIEQDLRSHFQSVSIKVLGSWVHRGNLKNVSES
jgi:hypothetical protein